jgi:hypothetical protein
LWWCFFFILCLAFFGLKFGKFAFFAANLRNF